MSLKLCFNNEIHKCAKFPDSYDSLLKIVKKIFKDTLPSNFGLQYDDSDGDRIMIASDEDFKELLASSTKAIKVFVIPKESYKQDNSLSIISKNDFDDQYLVLDNKNMNSSTAKIDIELTSPQTAQLIENYSEKELRSPIDFDQIPLELTL